MSACPDCLKETIEVMAGKVKETLVDGKISLAEAWGLVIAAVIACIPVIAHWQDADAGHRRQAVIVAVVHLWEEYLKPLDIPGPDAVIDPAVSAALPFIVGALYDSLLAWSKD